MVSDWQLEAELIGSVRLELVMEGLPVRNCCLIYSRIGVFVVHRFELL